MDKKLIGYKIKSEYLHSKKSILESIDCDDASDLGGVLSFRKDQECMIRLVIYQ